MVGHLRVGLVEGDAAHVHRVHQRPQMRAGRRQLDPGRHQSAGHGVERLQLVTDAQPGRRAHRQACSSVSLVSLNQDLNLFRTQSGSQVGGG